MYYNLQCIMILKCKEYIMDRDEYIRSFETRPPQKRPPQRYRKKKVNKKKLYAKRALIIICMLLIVAAVIGIFACTCNSCASNCTGGSTHEGDSTNAPFETQTQQGTQGEVQTTAPQASSNDKIVKYVVKDDGKDAVYLSDVVYLYNDKGYNIFGGTDAGARHYAQVVSDIADSLDDEINVYCLVAPNHSEFGLPERVAEDLGCTSQADNIQCIYDNMSDRVITVNAYNELSEHVSEYIYFGTDHHWTGLGAYYGYTAFCKRAGIEPMKLEGKNTIEGFRGTLYTQTGSSTLSNNPDHVDYYDLPVETYAYMVEHSGDTMMEVPVYYPAAEGGSNTYGLFCWGDVAQFVIHSEAGTGKKIAVVKDSYGNALCPYLAANYDEVHVIDFRHWDVGDLRGYLAENGIEDVLFINNTMSANTPQQVDAMQGILS